MSTRSRRLRSLVATVAAAALTATGALVWSLPAAADDLPSPPPLLQPDESVVTSDPLPTVQIDNGYVWAQETIGTTVYAVGEFQNARAPLAAPGTSLTPRSNILAFDITTGDLLPFAPTVNGVIKGVAASPDGSRIYIGGSFNSVNGQARWNFAALDAATGELVPGFNPSIGGTGVYAVETHGNSIFVGGLFTQANGTARKNLAAFSATNGALLPWTPETDRQVDAMVMDPQSEKVIVGGRFSTTNGNAAMRGLAAVYVDTGEIDPDWATVQTIKNGWGTGGNAGRAGIFALAADHDGVYGTGWVFAGVTVGNLEGTFAAEAGTGDIRWVADCLGDHYGVYSTGEVVYSTSHTHACSTMDLWPEQSPREHRYVEAYTTDARGTLGRNPHAGGTYQNWEGTPGPSAYSWFPDFSVGVTSGMGQAGLSVTGAGEFISIAGEFRAVNNARYEGIVRFSTNPPGGANDGPRLTGTSWGTPTAQSSVAGRVQVSIQANWDRDDKDLTYDLIRDGVSTPVASNTVASGWWYRPQIQLADRGLSPGDTHTYRIRVTDADGNSVTSQPVNATVATGVASAYADTVLDDGPSLYYPLGSSTQDWAGTNAPLFGSAVSAVQPGAVVGSASGYSQFAGNTNGRVSTTSTATRPAEFSTELWFNTTTTRGGKLIGYGAARTGNSSSHDRHVYMSNNGQLVFGVYPGSVKTIQSPDSYNNGDWHHVVATQGAGGMRLFVDGQLVASDAAVTTAEAYTGYWRIGGDNLSGWPNQPTSGYFAGAIDEVAVYSYPLSHAQVSNHYAAGSGFEAPTAEFDITVDDLEVTLDASASTASGAATIEDYIWDFGDESATANGVSISHTYTESGSYTVTLTVRDSNGLESSTEQEIGVLGPNAPPTAAFTSDVTGLTVAVNASDSADSDGEIVSYEWDWGQQGETSAGIVTSHTYAEPGTYTVTLTVTDDRDASATTTSEVEVTHADPVAVFTSSAVGRTVTVDASGSSASNGASLEYQWDWGDGSSVSEGVTVSHIYPADDDYSITLTVTDSIGASSDVSHSVSVTSTVFAGSDDFNRSVTNGWGTADAGGLWTPMTGSASAASVESGEGVLTLPAGGTRSMALQNLALLDTESVLDYTMRFGPDNGAAYSGMTQRQGTATGYTVHAWHRNDGTIWLVAQHSGAVIATSPVSGPAWESDSSFTLRTEVSGSDPTTLRARIWAQGSQEPQVWQLETTDGTGGLQQAGFPSVRYSLAASAGTPGAIAFQSVSIRDLQGSEEPAENVPPVAQFTAELSGLSLSVDGSASTDEDGSIESYSWDWGDGSPTDSGVVASHVFDEAGTYTVALTVVDDDGASHTASEDVTVEQAEDPDPEDPDENVPPVANFTADVSGLTLTVDGSASSDQDGSIESYSWDWGDGSEEASGVTASHTFPEVGTYTVSLTVVDNQGASHTAAEEVSVEGVDPEPFLIHDDFGRTESGGWGAADVGGAWLISGGSTSVASVVDGQGRFTLAPGETRNAVLASSEVSSHSAFLDFEVDYGPESGSGYVGLYPRLVGSNNYLVAAWMRPDGQVWLAVKQGATVIGVAPVAGLTFVPGDRFQLRVELDADEGTSIRARVWKYEEGEPNVWQVSVLDQTASLQQGGSVGIHTSRSASASTPGLIGINALSVVSLE